MKTNTSILFFLLLPAMLLIACLKKANTHDASGTFEAVETIIPADASGIIKSFEAEEGQLLDSGAVVGYIDSTQLYLKKKQLEAQINTILSKKPNIAKQLAAYEEQLKQAEHERTRIERLVKLDAATTKQLDDANTQVLVVRKQMEALQSSLSITSSGLTEETGPIFTQIEQVKDQLRRCVIINPVHGTVLTRYAEPFEMAIPGKPLYKIADLTSMTLRAYITGDQFAARKLGDQVTVLVDDANGAYRSYQGTIEWISDLAEFTPKTIQTKDERANLVYAIKINVPNDGLLKIGMYAEVKF